MSTKRIFFSGLKGGVGTSSIVANIACALKFEGEDVLAIDLDKKNELRLHFGMDWQNTLGWTNSFSEPSNSHKWIEYFLEDSDGVKFLPFGSESQCEPYLTEIIKQSRKLNLQSNTWVLFDCPSHITRNELALEKNDVLIEVVNCDPACHSLINMFNKKEQTNQSHYEHYFLINKFNSNSEIEVDLYQLWRDSEKKLAPFFIHSDEVIKEALAFKNVAFNCAPHSVVIDDFKTLISWLISKFND